MLSLVLAATFFAGIHLGVAGTTWRDRAVAALGEGAYRAVFQRKQCATIATIMQATGWQPHSVRGFLTAIASYAAMLSEDGNGRALFTKAIEYSDFPLAEISLDFIARMNRDFIKATLSRRDETEPLPTIPRAAARSYETAPAQGSE